jgi:hypothetical protein
MSGTLRRPLSIAGRVSNALRRVAGCVAISPTLCLQLAFWRLTLPILKFLVPMRLLARIMWLQPSPLVEPGTADTRLRSLLYVWQHGGRLLISPNCLEKSLVLYRLLSRQGLDPSLVFGVTRSEAGVAGHAWIETDGRVFHDDKVHLYDRAAIFGAHGQPAEIRS